LVVSCYLNLPFSFFFFLIPPRRRWSSVLGAPAENSQISNVAKAKNFPYRTLILSHFHYLGTTTLTSLPTPASPLASLSPTAWPSAVPTKSATLSTTTRSPNGAISVPLRRSTYAKPETASGLLVSAGALSILAILLGPTKSTLAVLKELHPTPWAAPLLSPLLPSTLSLLLSWHPLLLEPPLMAPSPPSQSTRSLAAMSLARQLTLPLLRLSLASALITSVVSPLVKLTLALL
jgi:hypothetical protein